MTNDMRRRTHTGKMHEISFGVIAGRKEMVIGICNEVVWYCPVERACVYTSLKDILSCLTRFGSCSHESKV